MSEDKKRRLTDEEVLEGISEIANDPEAGAQRLRALQILRSQNAATVFLPTIRADGEVIDRLARVMKGAGAELTQVAYQKAFPNAKQTSDYSKKTTYATATEDMKQQAAPYITLKKLRKGFPELTGIGVPKGYPLGRSVAVKADWCRNQALMMLVERHEKTRQESHEAMTAADTEIRGTTDGSASTSPGLQEPRL